MTDTSPFKIPSKSLAKSRTREEFDILDLLPEKKIPVFWITQELANGKKKLGVEQKHFIEFLEYYGFRKIVTDGEVTYVRVHLNILYEATIPEIKDFIVKFFESVKGDVDAKSIMVTEDFSLDVLEKFFYSNTGSIFDVKKLEMIKSFEGEMYQPGKWDNAFFFKDCWVKVSHEGCVVHEYKELPPTMSIWSNAVIDFELKQHGRDTDCDFQEFIRLITGNKNADNTVETNEKKKRTLEQAIGYLMHPFFEGALRAILLTDVNSNNQKANGRTGKGLIAKAISTIFPTSIIPAKRWKSDEKFNFSQVNKDDRLIVLDDLPNNFESEWVFNNITEGTIVKKMYKSEFLVRTKMLLLTNKMIKGDGSSTRGRFLEFEIENFFNHKYKPIDHFGRNFFSKHDWDDKEYAAFFWYLISCSEQNLRKIKEGLDCGVEYEESASIEKKRLSQNLEEDFISFMDMKCSAWFSHPNSSHFEIKDLKTEYLDEQNTKFRAFSSKKFKDWILEYCDYKGYTLELVSKGNNRMKYQIVNQTSIA